MNKNLAITLAKCRTAMFGEKNLYRALLIIAVFFTPICFFFFQQNAFFTLVGYIDPFIYVGYGYNYADYTFLNNYYKIARLPWVLVQFFSRSLINPDLVGYALHFTIYAAASYFIFRIAEKISGILPAFMLAILTPIFLNLYSGGTDYNNNFSAVLFLGFILYILNAANARKDSEQNFFLTVGALYALIIHTNILLSLDALVYGTAFYAAAKLNRDEKVFDAIGKKIIFAFGGFLLCTIILGLINDSFGRHFLFMKPLWKFMLGPNPGNNDHYWQPLNNFIWNTKYLAHFFALFFFSVFLSAYLFFKKLHQKNILLFLLNLAFIFTICEAFLTQIAGINNLQISYFAFIILPPFLLTFSANLGFIFNNKNLNLNPRQTLALAVIGAIFLMIVLLNVNAIHSGNFFFDKSSFLDMSAIWLLLFGLSFIFRKNLNYFSAGFLVLIYFLITAFTTTGYLNFKRNDRYCNDAKSMTNAYIEFNNHVRKYKFSLGHEGNIFTWWNKEQNLDYNESCKHLPPQIITSPAMSLVTATSGFAQPIDNPWLKEGINKIGDLWKSADGKTVWEQTNFLNHADGARVIIVISYDDKDVQKMIAKMKQYKLTFSYLEKVRIIEDSFTLQYYILKEEKLK